ncbi:MAG: nucleotide exchange factor GrpE, partial [Phycisphaerae bacterium]|nr:nucleotide exchange factor GrpE [Phycisphaerae bacterium]
TPIAAEGDPFDPQRHEAMMTEPVEQYDAPTVLRELQRGYEFRGRVLRPTRVVISAPPAEDDSEQGQ